MRKYRNQILAGLLFISLALASVVLLTGVDELTARLRDFPVWLFLPVFALKVVNWSLRYLEWRYFLGVIGVRTVRHQSSRPALGSQPAAIRESDSIILWTAGMTFSLSPGKLGEVLKALILKNFTGTDFTRSAPVIFMERLVDGLAVILLVTASMFFIGDSLDGSDLSGDYVRGVLFGTTLALLVIVAIVQVRPLSLWLLDQFARLPLLHRIESGLRNLYESSYQLLKVRRLIVPTVYGIGAYLTDAIGFFLLLHGLGIDGTVTLFGQALFTLGFSVIIAALSAMPGGAGGRELTVGALLTGVVGLSKAEAGTATFLISVFQVWIGVLLGLLAIALFRNILFPASLEREIHAYETAQSSR